MFALFLSPASQAQTSDNASVYVLDSPLLRVALMRFETAKEIWVRADPGGFLSSTDGKVCQSGSGIWRVQVQNNAVIVRDARGKVSVLGREATARVFGAEPETVVGVCLPSGICKFYRGTLEVSAVDGHLRVINEVPLESYLRGVIGSEIGSAPPEALKAQAIAARTYALHSNGKWAKDGYDVRDTPDSQVYIGTAGERTSIDEAIAATEGQILLWNGKPAATQFCADCGGATTPPTLPDDFPVSARDDDAHGTTEKPNPPAWILRYTPGQFAALLNRSDKARGTGTLDGFDALETDVSGRVRRLRVTWRMNKEGEKGRKGEEETIQNLKTKTENSNDPMTQRPNNPTQFQPPTLTPLESPSPTTPTSTAGTLTVREITGNTLRSLLGLDTLKSTLFTVKHEKSGEYVIIGRGYGHGKGMCQTGAIALAIKGFDCCAILNRYYAGAVFAKIIYSDSEGTKTEPMRTVSASRGLTPKP